MVGIDIEPSQIELARTTAAERGTSNARFAVGDLYSLPVPDESFDAVFLHGVLEHLRDPVRGLREVLRVLKRGGVLGTRHADFGGFLLEPASPPLDQFVPLFERLMLHNGADPQAGRHQLRWFTEAGFTRVEMSASYEVADLLQPPPSWHQQFDFVFEAYTIQVLPPDIRATAIVKIADFVAPDGTLLVVTRARDAADPPGQMPWPLLRDELNCDELNRDELNRSRINWPTDYSSRSSYI